MAYPLIYGKRVRRSQEKVLVVHSYLSGTVHVNALFVIFFSRFCACIVTFGGRCSVVDFLSLKLLYNFWFHICFNINQMFISITYSNVFWNHISSHFLQICMCFEACIVTFRGPWHFYAKSGHLDHV